MTETDIQPATAEETTYCTVHTDRETSLRCNKCGRLMCAECAVLTPVGYRCRECVRQHEDKFFNASQADYTLIFLVCAGLMALAGGIVAVIGLFLILIFIIAIPVGGAVAEVALRATQRRRGRYSGQVAMLACVVGGLVGGGVSNYLSFISDFTNRFPNRPIPPLPLDFWVTNVVSDISLLVFIGVVAVTVYSRFRMRI